MEETAKDEWILATEAHVRGELEDEASGHDWWHIARVARIADRLAREEGADRFVCAMAALLHDLADEKLNGSKEAGMKRVTDWLDSLPCLDEADRRHVLGIVSTLSYNAGANPPMATPEGRVVQDADRLDALGAIGIARTFAYAGWRGQPMHDPALPPRGTMTPEEYRQGRSTAVNHFHEKLFKLAGLMNTASARRMAEEREAFMRAYLERFGLEWEGGL